MPIVVAAAITAGAAIYAAHKQSSSTKDAADIQTKAANYAADVESKSTSEALDFQKQQSAQDQANFNSTSSANYGQWAAREGRLSSIGQALGLPARNIPAFVPSPTLDSTQTAPNSGQTAPGQQPSGSDPASYALSLVSSGMSPDKAAAQTNAKFNLQTGSQAVYYPENNTIGLPNAYLAGPTGRPDSPAQWNITPRVGGSSAATGATRAPVPATLGQAAMYSASPYTPITPALTAPPVGSLASYARRAY